MLADGYGNVVHLGERECSLQRRHQKVIEEAPSPLLDAATRARIGAAACDTARSVDYTGAGTVEFIVSADRPDEFFFMEMNTRLQVEHPVTEMVTGIDLVEQQVRIAAGEKLPIAQDDVTLTGHAIEARVYAEDPGRGFLPTGGAVLDLAEPDGPGVRVDSGSRPRHGGRQRLRPDAVQGHRARRRPGRAPSAPSTRRWPTPPSSASPPTSSSSASCWPIPTWSPAASTPGCSTAACPTSRPRSRGDRELIAAAAYKWLRGWPDPVGDLWAVPSGWRIGRTGADDRSAAFRRPHRPRPPHRHPAARPAAASRTANTHSLTASLDGDRLTVTLDGLRTEYLVAAADGQIWLSGAGHTAVVERGARSAGAARRRTQRRRRTDQPDAGFGCRRRCFRRRSASRPAPSSSPSRP